MTGPPVVHGRAIRVVRLDRHGFPLEEHRLTADHKSFTIEPRRTMSIRTMDELAAVPIGTRIFYGDDTYKRVDVGWWAIGDGDTPTIRDRHLVGAVESGRVSLEDNRLLKKGTICEDATYWYLLEEDAAEGNVRCTIIRRDNGEVAYTNHAMPVGSIRRHVLAEQPTWGPAFKSVIDRLAEKDKVIQEYNTRVAEVTKTITALQQSMMATTRFRSALKEFMEASDDVGDLTVWDGVKIGDEMKRGHAAYNSLPIGSVVQHQHGSYWWKETQNRWRSRNDDATSSSMATNTLVTIGNGISADPGTEV